MTRLAVAVAFAALAAPWGSLAADAGTAPEGAGAVPETPPPAPRPQPRRLETTADVEGLSVSYLHVVLERKGDRIEVSELMTLRSREGTRFSAPRGLRVALPSAAVAPRTTNSDGAQLEATVDAGGFVITDPIGPGGDDLSIGFEVPISGGVAAFEQRLPAPAEAFEVVSTWTRSPARLRVAGAGDAVQDELGSGLVGLIAMGRAPARRTLAVTLSGIDDGVEKWVRRAALAVCIALFAAGLVAFTRRRRKEPR